MNKLRYRIVFNKLRGQCMVVAETARSHGKNPGQGGARDTSHAESAWPSWRRMAIAVAGAYGGLLLAGPALAQIVADPSAPGQQRATVLNAANGVLQVNVQTPSAAGVSRNVYSQFDVPRTGAILNNSRENVQSQLSGWIQGNPWMTKGTARVILNEVNSSDPSKLRGFIEVAGDRAETVIANPAGISVDGGGFINVSRATLTTGTPIINDGRLDGYSVQRGQITIEGAGLDASKTDYTALIARAMTVNASVWAQQLKVITGANRVDEADSTPVAQQPDSAGAAPRYALDVGLLGGMYANKIFLVGTEAGLGVRNAGEIGASAGDLVVTSEGRLENSGSLLAKQMVQVNASGVANSGKVGGDGGVQLAVQGDVDNRGGSISAPRVEIASAAGDLLNAGGKIVQSAAAGVSIDSASVRNREGGTIGEAPTVSDAGTGGDGAGGGGDGASDGAGSGTGNGTGTGAGAGAGGGTTPVQPLADGLLRVRDIDNTAGLITAGGNIQLKTGAIDNTAGSLYLANLAVDGSSFANNQGKLQVQNNFSAKVTDFSNRAGQLLVGGPFNGAPARFDSAAGLLQAKHLQLSVAEDMDNSGGTLRQTGQELSHIEVGGELLHTKGTLELAAGLELKAGSISGKDSKVSTAGDLLLNSGRTNAAGSNWTVDGKATLRTGTFDNSKGALSASGDINLTSAAIANRDGKVASSGSISVNASGAMDNTGGYVQAAKDLVVTSSGALTNANGVLEADGSASAMQVKAVSIDNQSGRIANAGQGNSLLDSRTNIFNSGQIGANGKLQIKSQTLSNTAGATIQSVGDMDMAVQRQVDNAGATATAGNFSMAQGQATLNNSGTLVAGRDAIIVASDIDNTGGQIATATGGAGNIVLQANSLKNSAGTIQADHDGTLVIAGQIENRRGQVITGRDLQVRAGANVDNAAGMIEAGGQLKLQATNIGNTGGRIAAIGNGGSEVVAFNTISNGGIITANGDLYLGADLLTNAYGANVVAGRSLVLAVTRQLSNQGTVSSAGTLHFVQDSATLLNSGLMVSGSTSTYSLASVINDGGHIATADGSGAALNMSAGSLSNRAGTIIAPNDMSLVITGGLDNDGGLIQSGTNLAVRAGDSVSNVKGIIEVTGTSSTLLLEGSNITNVEGRIVNAGQGLTTVNASNGITNTGLIAGNGKLVVAAKTLDNSSSGVVSAGGTLDLAVSTRLDNAGTISSAGDLKTNQSSLDLRNSGTIVAGGHADITAGSINNDGGKLATARGSHGDMLLNAETISNQSGTIMADNNTVIKSAGAIDNRQGLIQSKLDMQMTAGGTLNNGSGTIETLSNASLLAVQAGAIQNTVGRIANVGISATTVRAATTLDNSGLIGGNGQLTLEAQSATNSASGVISAVGPLHLQVHTSLDNAGSISSQAGISMNEAGASLTNSGAIVFGADATLTAGAIRNDGGQIVAAQNSAASVALQGDSLSNRAGTIASATKAVFTLAGALDNTGGTIHSEQELKIAAGGRLDNAAGVIESVDSGATLDVTAGAIANGDGRIVNVGQGAANVSSAGMLDNAGLIAGNGRLAVAAQTLTNSGTGTIASAGAMAATIGQQLDNAGTISSGSTMDVQASGASVANTRLIVAQDAMTLRTGAFSNNGGTIEMQAANAGLNIQAASLDNLAGRVVNAGTGDTTIAADGGMTNTGLIAGNGKMAVSAAELRNLSGGALTAGGPLDMTISQQMVNAGTIGSGGAFTLAASGASVSNSGIITAGADATLQTAAFSNDGGQLGTLQGSGGKVALTATSIRNVAGTLIADGTATLTATAAIVNSHGVIQGHDTVALAAGGALDNTSGVIESVGANATLDLQAASIDNTSGRIVNTGVGKTNVAAAGTVLNSGTIAGNGLLDLSAAALTNQAAGKIASGTTMELAISQQLSNAGSISSGGILHMDQASAQVSNSGQIASGGALFIHAAQIGNDGGAIATLGAGASDLILDSDGNLSNRNGAIGATGNVTLDAGGSFDNRQGQVQTPGRLAVSAAGALDNSSGALEATGSGSTLNVQAQSITNTSGRVINAGVGQTTIGSQTALTSSGTIAGNGALDLRAQTLQNSSGGVVSAGGSLDLGVNQQITNQGSITSAGSLTFLQGGAGFTNSGVVGAGGYAWIMANAINNNGGQIFTVRNSGSDITMNGSSLSNTGGQIVADGSFSGNVAGTVANGGGIIHAGNDLNLTLDGALTNGSGTIEAAGSGSVFDLRANSISSSGRMVNAGAGAMRVTASGAIDNSGTLAGNGALTLNALSLQNRTGAAVGSGAGLMLNLSQSLSNQGAITSAGSLTFNQGAASFTNSGQIASGGSAVFNAASFDNRGGKISTVRGSGADITITAPQLSNQGGAVLADGKATFTIGGAVDNSGGTLQAGKELQLTATGAVTNQAGVIESIGATGALTIDAASINNGTGRVTNLGTGDTKLLSKGDILSSGTIAANGKLLLSGLKLQNAAGGTVAASRDMTLTLTQQVSNLGKINSGGTLTFQQANADFINSGQVMAGGNAVILARTINNDGGQIITGANSGADLALTSQQMSNQGGQVLSDRDLVVSTRTMSAVGELFGGRDLSLAMDGNYTQGAGTQQFHSNRDLSLTVTGDITNTSVFEAVRNLTLKANNITNQAGATIRGEGVTLQSIDYFGNDGEINGETSLSLITGTLNNSSGIVGGSVYLHTWDLNNTGASALVGATGDMALWVNGTLANTGNATIYSAGNMSIGATSPGGSTILLRNNSSTIEAGGNLSLAATNLENIRENVVIQTVQTVDETVQMQLPSWSKHGRNPDRYDPNSSNYRPREVYFVNPADVLEDSTFVTPDGYTIGRAVIRTHANDSVFFSAVSSAYSQYGHRERLYNTDGTRVIYYVLKNNAANPDQGGPGGVNAWHDEWSVKTWDGPAPSFDSSYGSCSTNCIRFMTEPDYNDPVHTINRDNTWMLAPQEGKLEKSRLAHHVVMEDKLMPGAGSAAQIIAGGNMSLTVNSSLTNRYADIKARGSLAIGGGAAITNEGATLYRTHKFNGTWTTDDGTVTAYTRPDISEVAGSAAGTIQGGQGVTINARSFNNVDVTAGTVGNIRDSVVVLGSGAAGANAAGGGASSSGASGGASAGGSFSGSASGNHAALIGSASGSGVVNNANGQGSVAASGAASGVATGSGFTSSASANGQANASGTSNALAVEGEASGSGLGNSSRLQGTARSSRQARSLGDVRSSASAAIGQSAAAVKGASVGGAVKQVALGGLFQRNPDPGGQYLFETRSQFANLQDWTSSDYLLRELSVDPRTTQKRLGDGFYEQRLVREQMAELTGSAPQSGASDDAQYKALLSNALSFAKEFDLRPGIALSAEQVSHLTSDIVWLESQTVQLPDGSTENVLVPKGYLAHVDQKAIQPGGALVSGGAGVAINVSEDIVNRGGVIDGGNGRTLLIAGQDITNSGGAIKGSDVGLYAARDVKNETLVVQQNYASTTTSGGYTNLSNQASIAATGELNIQAGRDLVDVAGKITAGSADLFAGRDVSINTVQTGSTYQSQVGEFSNVSSSINHQLSQISTAGDLTIAASRDLQLSGAQLEVGTSGKGDGQLLAGRDLTISAVTNEVNTSLQNDPSSKKYDKVIHQNQTVVGTTATAAGDLVTSAGLNGQGSLTITASTLAGGGEVLLAAKDNVKILSATENHLSDIATHRESSSFMKSSSSTVADYSNVNKVIGSAVSGEAVTVKSGQDIVIGGSQLTAANALTLDAGRDLLVSSVEQTDSERHSSETKKSGFSFNPANAAIGYSKSQGKQSESTDSITQIGSVLSGGTVTATSGHDTVITASTVVADGDIAISAKRDLSIVSAENRSESETSSFSKKSGSIGTNFQPAFGTVKTTNDGSSDSVTQAGSQVASLGANVKLTAGEQYTQTASGVMAPQGDITIAAQDVLINAALNRSDSTDHSSYSKTALGGTVNVPIVNALQTVGQMASAAKDAGDSRMKALAALNAVGSLGQAYQATENLRKGIKVSISLGNQKSENTILRTSETVVGSTVEAGGDVRIAATGAGKDSNLTAIGSDIKAGDNVSLSADNEVNLLAARNAASQHSTNSSSGTSIGIGFGIGPGQTGFTLELAASKARGNADGDDVGYSNTHVAGGNQVSVASGGDTNVKGGLIAGQTVIADVGGNLSIESLQDSSKYDSKQKSAGVNLSLCIPPFCYGTSTVGGNFSKSTVNGDFLSVIEQSGIKAGDGGFQVRVDGNTDLKGGLLASSQTAVDQELNSLTTASLTASDLQNKDNYSASGFALSGSVSGSFGNQSDLSKSKTGADYDADKKAAESKGLPSAGGGFASAAGSQGSTTASAISGGVISITDQAKQVATGKDAEATLAGVKRDVTTETAYAASGVLVKDWDGQNLQKEIDAGVAITQEFSRQAPKAIAKFADDKVEELKDKGASAEEIANWKEGGIIRTALHAISGALTGGMGGALGSAAVANSANLLNDLQDKAKDALVAQGLSPEAARVVAQGVAEATSLSIGAAVGGAAGGATALATDTNNRQLHWQNFLNDKEACGKNPKGSGCDTILKIAGVRSQILDFMGTATSNVAVNMDANGRVVSYTILDKTTNRPMLIMEPLEFDAFRNSTPGFQAMLRVAPQYVLDFASAGLYRTADNTGKAGESLMAGVTSSDYGRDVAFGVFGAAATSISFARPTASVMDSAARGTRADVPTSTSVSLVDLNARVDDGMQYVQYLKHEGTWDWPLNQGFKNGEKFELTLPIGTMLDRVGEPNGAFTAPTGTPFEQRALAPGSGRDSYYQYEVIKPLPVYAGEIAPAFGQAGGGTQFLPNVGRRINVDWLEKAKYIKKVGPNQ